MRKPSNHPTFSIVLVGALATAFAFGGCIWDFNEGCDDDWGDECVCEDCDYPSDPPDDPEDTDDEEEDPEDYWEDYECDDQDPLNPCQEAMCEAIEGYIESLEDCVEVEEECDCTFLEECLLVYFACIDLSCLDQTDHDVGGMIDCSLTFALCIDPC
jgi:hypothetical protein